MAKTLPILSIPPTISRNNVLPPNAFLPPPKPQIWGLIQWNSYCFDIHFGKFMWTITKTWPDTRMKYLPEMKFHGGMSSFHLSCELTHRIPLNTISIMANFVWSIWIFKTCYCIVLRNWDDFLWCDVQKNVIWCTLAKTGTHILTIHWILKLKLWMKHHSDKLTLKSCFQEFI